MPRNPFPRLLGAVAVAAGLSLASAATQTRTALSSAQDLWEGTPDGVSVSADGVLAPGTAYVKAADLPGTPVCALRAGGVLWVGTGPGGDLLRVEGGKVSVFHHFDEPLVSALAILPGGDLLVGTSTPARVYRLAPATGKASLVAELQTEDVWALLPQEKGFFVATGGPGKIFRCSGQGEPALVLDAGAAHVRCLLSEGGAVWAGTASPALLYRVDGGSAFLVSKLDGEEAAALAPSGDGLLIAANEKAASSSDGAGDKTGKADGGALLLWQKGRAVKIVHSFPSPLESLCADGGAVLLGLGDGRLFSVRGDAVALSARWAGSPVAALVPGAGGTWVLTASPGAVLVPSQAGEHTYLSPVIDMAAPSRLGRTGVGGAGGTLFVRAGNSPKPGPFWSPWTEAVSAGGLPPCQYAQWKLDLGADSRVKLVSLAFRPVNRPPVIQSARVHPPGEIYVRMPSQIGDHLVREAHEKDSIFPGLAESAGQESPPQTYFLQGYRMVSWKVEDPDDDDVRVDLSIRPQGAKDWMNLARHLADNYYVFDARTLPDGAYDLRLTASDGASNPEGEALASVKDLPLFVVDNTPPAIQLVPHGADGLRLVVTDNTGVQAVRASVDGGDWTPLAPVSGEPGARRTEYVLRVPAGGAHWVAVQAVDPYRNESAAAWMSEQGGNADRTK